MTARELHGLFLEISVIHQPDIAHLSFWFQWSSPAPMIRDTIRFRSTAKYTDALRAIGNGDSSRRLALGVAMGILIGLIPKSSLFVWALGIVLMVSTANLMTALVTGLAASWIAIYLDVFTHRLGAIVLTDARLEPTWSQLYELPIVPWTLFNNTVVMGSLLTGLALFLPVYLLSESFFRTWGSAFSKACYHRFGHTWIYRWLAPDAAARHPANSEPPEMGPARREAA